MKNFILIVTLLTLSHLCWGQSNGYNYDRPQILPGGGGTRPGFPGTVGGGGFPGTATTPVFGGYPSGPSTAPGRPGFGSGTGTTGSTGFPSRPGISSDTPVGPVFTGPATGFPTGSGSSLPGGSRPGSGIRPTPPFTGIVSRPGTSPGSSFGGGTGLTNDDGSYPDGDYSAIPGTPGIDYPIFSDIPQTSFDCNQQQYPGYYADVETQCQVFHICALNKTFDFLCPNGTIFSQETLVCVWWNQFDCGSAPALYPNNAFIYDYTQTGRPVQQGGFGQPGSTGGPGGIGGGVTQRPGTGAGFPGSRPRPPTGPGAGYPPGPTGPTGFPGTGVGTGGFPGAGSGGPGGFPGAGTGSTVGFPTGPGATPPTPGGFPGQGIGSTASGFPSGPSTAGGASVTPPTGFGTTVRPGTGGFPTIQGDTGFIGGGPAVTPQTPNREYLPPRRT